MPTRTFRSEAGHTVEYRDDGTFVFRPYNAGDDPNANSGCARATGCAAASELIRSYAHNHLGVVETTDFPKTGLMLRMRALGASEASGTFLRWVNALPDDTTVEAAWETCPNGDWLVWLVARLHLAGLLPRRPLALAVCAATRATNAAVKGHAAEGPCLAALDAAEAYVHGRGNIAALQAAIAAAYTAIGAMAAAAPATPEHSRVNNIAYDAADAADVADSSNAKWAADVAQAISCWEGTAPAIRAAVPWAEVEAALGAVKP